MTQTTWERWSTDRGQDHEIVEERRSQREMKMRTDHEALVCNIYTFLCRLKHTRYLYLIYLLQCCRRLSPTLTAARGAPAARATLGTGGGDPTGGGTRARRSSRGRGSASSRIDLQTKVAENYQSFTITEKAPTRAFCWLKAPTTAFILKTLLRHYA